MMIQEDFSKVKHFIKKMFAEPNAPVVTIESGAPQHERIPPHVQFKAVDSSNFAPESS